MLPASFFKGGDKVRNIPKKNWCNPNYIQDTDFWWDWQKEGQILGVNDNVMTPKIN